MTFLTLDMPTLFLLVWAIGATAAAVIKGDRARKYLHSMHYAINTLLTNPAQYIILYARHTYLINEKAIDINGNLSKEHFNTAMEKWGKLSSEQKSQYINVVKLTFMKA